MARKNTTKTDRCVRHDARLQPPLDEQIAAITKAFGDVVTLARRAKEEHQAPDKDRLPTLWQHRRPESRTVALLGDRGTGKTTALEWLLDLLRAPSGSEAPAKRKDKKGQQKVADEWRNSLRPTEQLGELKVLVLPILDASVGDDEDSLRYQLALSLKEALLRTPLRDPSQPTAVVKTVEDLQYSMAGQDGAWRAATARLSGGIEDFGMFTHERVKAVVNYGSEFGRAVGVVLDATGFDVAVLPIDDLDLVPQRYQDVIGLLGDLRWADRLVVVIAADPTDTVLRIEDSLRAKPDSGKRDAELDNDLKLDYGRMAHRIFAKLSPVQWRSYLMAPSPGHRLAFPIREGEAWLDPKVRKNSIAGLLWHLGVIGPEHPGGRGAPYRPNWGVLLPDNVRGLDALLSLLQRLADDYDSVQDNLNRRDGNGDDGPVAKNAAGDGVNAHLTSTKADNKAGGADAAPDGDEVGRAEEDDAHARWWLERNSRDGSISETTLLAIGSIADVLGAYDWMRELQRTATAIGGYADARPGALFWFEFDLTHDPHAKEKAANNGEIGHLEQFQQLRSAVATGRRLEAWFALDSYSHLADPAADLPRRRPEAFAAPLANLLLWREPGYRVAFAARWWFTRKVLSDREVVLNIDNSPHRTNIMRVLEKAQKFGGADNHMPLYESFGELLSTCEELDNAEDSGVQFVAVDATQEPILRHGLDQLQVLFRGETAAEPGEWGAFVSGLWLLRRALFRAWLIQHRQYLEKPATQGPGVPEGSTGVSLVHVLERLLEPPSREMLRQAARVPPALERRVLEQAQGAGGPDDRWDRLVNNGRGPWMDRDDWGKLLDLLKSTQRADK